jgi:hypothetical protein
VIYEIPMNACVGMTDARAKNTQDASLPHDQGQAAIA